MWSKEYWHCNYLTLICSVYLNTFKTDILAGGIKTMFYIISSYMEQTKFLYYFIIEFGLRNHFWNF